MIFLKFQISNPFISNGVSLKQRDFILFDKPLTKNKSFSIQLTKWKAHKILDFSLDTHLTGQHHAGIEFQIELIGLFLDIKFYDNRHWDYENNTWEVYEENPDANLH
jgi:hypothetical protein